MQSMLIIGLGDFGHYLCRHLVELKNEVMVMDQKEEALEDLKDIATDRIVADCTSRSTLESVGVSDFDKCFVCIGSDFRSNLIIVTLLKELGAKYIVSQTEDEMLEKLLKNNGADAVVHPNKYAAYRTAISCSSDRIFDYTELRAGYGVYEIAPLDEWVGKTILESDIRKNYNIYIIGITRENGDTSIMPEPQMIIEKTDQLMALSDEKTIASILDRYEKKRFRL